MGAVDVRYGMHVMLICDLDLLLRNNYAVVWVVWVPPRVAKQQRHAMGQVGYFDTACCVNFLIRAACTSACVFVCVERGVWGDWQGGRCMKAVGRSPQERRTRAATGLVGALVPHGILPAPIACSRTASCA